MAENGGLNGAYYGPSVLPQKSYPRPSRGGDCLCGCGCCIIKLLLKIIFTIVIILSILAFIFWLIFRPNLVKFRVTEAQLTQFNFTKTTNTLFNYNLKLNLTIRNLNKRIGIYYDRIEARALYEDQRFDVEYLTPFYQSHKNTTILIPVFEGQVVVLGTSELLDYNKDRAAGVYVIDVKLYLRVRFKLGKIKTFRFKPKMKCDLKVPLTTSSGGSTIMKTFETKKCDIDWRIF